ncbi:MAG: LD-carboxypeptidase [Deltaproteobacteria bacterium]|nr:LD-carboxypeptidase [Deltaproteobacteria bacterium]
MSDAARVAAGPFGLVAPAGPLHDAGLDAGLDAAATLGIAVAAFERAPLTAGAGAWHLAGTDAERAARLAAAARSTPAGIWMARGGFGSARTLAALGADALDALPPTPIWGFSDGTALVAAWARRGRPAWHAPPLVQLPRLDAASRERLLAAMQHGEVADLESLSPISCGTAQGPLAGGNLCVLGSLVGTPWAAELRGAIVVLEDVGEPAYKVDRLLTQLRLAGAFDGVVGLVYGAFTDVPEAEEPLIARVLDAFAADLGVPAARGLPVGHGAANAALPFGRGTGHVATLDVRPGGAALRVARARS